MRFEPSCSYESIRRKTVDGQTALAWLSRGREDLCWDKFLQESPPGQYQQSTMWARAKEAGGWRPVRVVLTLGEQIVGGFQILRCKRWWGGIGYISKGPVVSAKHPEMADYAAELARDVSRRERLLALVVQPPDTCEQMAASLAAGGFSPGAPVDVSMADWYFDLRGGLEVLESQMSRQTRRKVRQAVRRGVAIREGGRQDMELFFHLMESTCRRQGVDPSPPDVSHLLALWDAAHPLGRLRLFFAEHDGRVLSGLLCIAFGKTFTMWKRGWSGMEGEGRPNELITFEALKWAVLNGYDFCDYPAFDERMAMAIQNGLPLSPEQERSRYCFITRFGGMARFAGEPRQFYPNPLVRSAVMFFKRGSTVRRNR
ncbi:MAG: GNAT family N-acetyltransferase [Syntrophobacteraceae bacterium]|nr:GNAT family N-acetyltransferase [Syntrophobacteraceae bacterium]